MQDATTMSHRRSTRPGPPEAVRRRGRTLPSSAGRYWTRRRGRGLLVVVPARAVVRASVVLVAGSLAAFAAGRTSPLGSAPLAARAPACGVERWPVKIAAASTTARVNFVPRTTSVRALRRLRRPFALPQTRTNRPVETTTYRVHARLVEAKFEDDSDFHLVLADPRTGGTMIVEFPGFAFCLYSGATFAATAEREQRNARWRCCSVAVFGSLLCMRTPRCSSANHGLGTGRRQRRRRTVDCFGCSSFVWSVASRHFESTRCGTDSHERGWEWARSVASPPSCTKGTVTFLFTDIEGSTRLLIRLGERYGAVLGEHRRILREAAEAREGREIDAQGDGFFFAFARANAALGAVVVAQRALAEHDMARGWRGARTDGHAHGRARRRGGEVTSGWGCIARRG